MHACVPIKPQHQLANTPRLPNNACACNAPLFMRHRWVADGRQLLTADARGGCYLWSPDSGALLWDLSTSEDRHGSLGQDCCAVAAPGGCVARGTSCGMLLVHCVAPAVQQLVPVLQPPKDIRCEWQPALVGSQPWVRLQHVPAEACAYSSVCLCVPISSCACSSSCHRRHMHPTDCQLQLATTATVQASNPTSTTSTISFPLTLLGAVCQAWVCRQMAGWLWRLARMVAWWHWTPPRAQCWPR